MNGRLIHGDALEKLKELPAESIDCSMSSPPYWALRDYGVEGQLGLEKTPEEFISKLCDIYDEVKHVLKPTGTCWVNLGDTYAGSWGNYAPGGIKGEQRPKTEEGKRWDRKAYSDTKFKPPSSSCNIQEKSLICIPFRFAIEMINRGWILRNTIIWKKNNCMPQSAKDRFTVDFEYIFFFSKETRYYFDMQREPHKSNMIPPKKTKEPTDVKWENGAQGQTPHSICHKGRSGYFNADGTFIGNPEGRNKRCVWTINTKPFPDCHFAVYPEELCETPIKAGCPEFVCKKCGKPKRKTIEVGGGINAFNIRVRDVQKGRIKAADRNATDEEIENYDERNYEGKRTEYVIAQGCSCDAGYEPGTVLDPFLGSGTTALVAEKLNRKWIGIELNEEYVKIAEKRLEPYKAQTRLNEYADKPVPEAKGDSGS